MSTATLPVPAEATANDDNPIAHLKCPVMPRRALCGTPLRSPAVQALPGVERCVVCQGLSTGHDPA